MREDEPRDPSLALCQICKRAYRSKTSVRDYSNNDQIREYRTCPLLFTGDCNAFVPLNPNASMRTTIDTLDITAENFRDCPDIFDKKVTWDNIKEGHRYA